MELVFIRHFKTPGNRLHQYIGSTDENIDRELIPKNQKEYPIVDALVTSPMKRCVQTAELIYPGQKSILCKDLREMDFGKYERKTYKELKDEEAYQKWIESGGMGAFPGGEDRKAFEIRCQNGIRDCIDRLISEHKKTAAFVVHGGTIMAVLSKYDEKQRSFYDWQTTNGNGFYANINEEEWTLGKQVFYNIRPLFE